MSELTKETCLVGLGHLLEFGLRLLLIARVLVGVPPHCQPPVRLPEVIIGGIAIHLQYVVVIHSHFDPSIEQTHEQATPIPKQTAPSSSISLIPAWRSQKSLLSAPIRWIPIRSWQELEKCTNFADLFKRRDVINPKKRKLLPRT